MEASNEEQENRVQQELRKRIREIQMDTSLTPQEKATKMQLVMSGKWVDKAREEAQKTQQENQQIVPSFFDESSKVYGCVHYKKNCAIKAPCCDAFYTCRRCHDDKTDHKINRYLIREMGCYLCGTQQPVAQNCQSCKASMARYYCNICKFFDDDDKKYIWHCDKCGICRVGDPGMVHCDLCNMCLRPDHKTHQSYDGNCPICSDSLFHGTSPVHRPKPCKHAFHYNCYKQYVHTNYVCPICSKTFSDFKSQDMWHMMDLEIAAARMPREYRNWVTEAICNDCEIRVHTPYHVFGHKCTQCGGYNTQIVTVAKNPPPEDNDEEEEEIEAEEEERSENEQENDGQ